jgi:D-glucosaminate-6-phosphate ammonia-lyase
VDDNEKGYLMDLHEKYRLTRIVNACGKVTKLAGAIVLPDVREVVTEAMGQFFDLEELQTRSGEVIAKATGAQWGCVTACTAAGITLSVAATMTGQSLGKIGQLPDTAGMKNEVVIQKGHTVNFGAPVTQMVRLAGAKVIEVGTVDGASEALLEHAIGDSTAAVLFVVSHHTVQFGCVTLARVVDLAHKRGVPVIVDGAAQSFLIKDIVATGADLVICSGHKYLSGTTAGVVCGKREWVTAVNLQNKGIGRPMKVGKEGILGVMAALEYRMKLDVAGWQKEQNRKMQLVLDQLAGIEGVQLSVDDDPNGNPFSRAHVDIDTAVVGVSPAVISAVLKDNDPAIHLRDHHVDEGFFTVDAMELTDEEVVLTCQRLREVLTASEAEKSHLMHKYGGGEPVDIKRHWLR